MFSDPILDIENIDDDTRLGIEIEICIKKDKYEKLGYITKTESYHKTYTFPGTHPFNVGSSNRIGEPNLNQIILTIDPSCECPKGYVSAEIISPKMNYSELPIYLNFLKTKILIILEIYYKEKHVVSIFIGQIRVKFYIPMI